LENRNRWFPFRLVFVFAEDLVFASDGSLDLWRAQNRYLTLPPGRGDVAVRCKRVKEPRPARETNTWHIIHLRNTDWGEIL
jgi:hypothetical protein